MADKYELKTETDAKVSYDDIEVDVVGESVSPRETKRVLQVKNEIGAIDDQIANLEAEKALVEAELVAIEKEAGKVLTATDKPK